MGRSAEHMGQPGYWIRCIQTWYKVQSFMLTGPVQLAVRWYKRHIKELSDDAALNTVDRRMSIELDKQLRRSDLQSSPRVSSVFSSGRKSIDDIGLHYRKQLMKVVVTRTYHSYSRNDPKHLHSCRNHTG